MSRRPRFLEFFAGAGLVRLGLKPGWKCVFANDNSEKKADVYRANFGSNELTVSDVAELDANGLPDADMAWASFPCQDLSLAGWRRGMSAPRSGAFWPFWSLMRDLHREKRRPPVIVIENVVGLLYGEDFGGLCEALAALDMRFGAMIVDAKWFVPQSRPRVFLIAVDKAIDTASLEQSRPSASEFFPQAIQSASDALPANLSRRWVWWKFPSPKPTAAELTQIVDLSCERSTEAARLLSLMNSTHREKIEVRQRAGGTHIGFLYRRTRGGRQRAEVRFDGLAGCIRTPEGGSSRQTVVIIEDGDISMRLLSSREAARLMGAPDSYRLPNRYNDAYRAMGDGVAVPVASYLGRNLLEPLTRSAC